MKIKKRFKDWRKLSKKERHEGSLGWACGVRHDRNRRLALKFARRALRHILKDGVKDRGMFGCGCGFRAECYDRPTSCLALGDCTDNPAFCPLDLARSLIRSLNFERVEVVQ